MICSISHSVNYIIITEYTLVYIITNLVVRHAVVNIILVHVINYNKLLINLNSVHNNERDLPVRRELHFTLEEGVDLHLVIGDTIIVQECSCFSTKWATLILI